MRSRKRLGFDRDLMPQVPDDSRGLLPELQK